MIGSLDLLLGNVKKRYLLNSVDSVSRLAQLSPDWVLGSLNYPVPTLRSQSTVIFLSLGLLAGTFIQRGEKAFIILPDVYLKSGTRETRVRGRVQWLARWQRVRARTRGRC